MKISLSPDSHPAQKSESDSYNTPYSSSSESSPARAGGSSAAVGGHTNSGRTSWNTNNLYWRQRDTLESPPENWSAPGSSSHTQSGDSSENAHHSPYSHGNSSFPAYTPHVSNNLPPQAHHSPRTREQEVQHHLPLAFQPHRQSGRNEHSLALPYQTHSEHRASGRPGNLDSAQSYMPFDHTLTGPRRM
ncbi:hypothetical protein K439DRAFT_295025 [Ramaria rubella]|nr:hypothetical protein K439DRAFT_295025 [Ramaria rubella]